MRRIVVVGGGFAGFWSAVGAARKLHERGVDASDIEVVLVSRDGYLGIRPRFYEADLADVRVPLDPLLDLAGVRRMEGIVRAVDPDAKVVRLDRFGKEGKLRYDRLVLAAGSRLHRPSVPGLEEHAFSTDTFSEAAALDDHLRVLPSRTDASGRYTVVVVGAGFTGLEVATEMVGRLDGLASRNGDAGERRVILIEQAPYVGPDLGVNPRPTIEKALEALGVETRVGTTVTSIGEDGVSLSNRERIPALTTVWTAGLRASPLTKFFPIERDRLGRLPVDENMKVVGVESVFAAGDVARAMADDEHGALMSCQHAIPQGKSAGHNAVSDLIGSNLLPYRQEDYVTCLDLGPWGAIFTSGWDRAVQSTGAEAKERKAFINRELIYPPRPVGRHELFEAARPERSTSRRTLCSTVRSANERTTATAPGTARSG